MIYSEESMEKRQKMSNELEFLHEVHRKYIFSFLDNLNSVRTVKRNFINLHWITRIKIILDVSPSVLTWKLCKLLKKREGGVEVLDISKWSRVNSSTVNRLLKLKALRGLKELVFDDGGETIDWKYLRIPPGIHIRVAMWNVPLSFLNVKGGKSTFRERIMLFHQILHFGDLLSVWPIFKELCTVLKVQFKGMEEAEEEEEEQYLQFFQASRRKLQFMGINKTHTSALFKIKTIPHRCILFEETADNVVLITFLENAPHNN